MSLWTIVLDTNVLVSALRSKKGASYRLLTLIGDRRIQTNVSVPLAIEYEKTIKSVQRETGLNRQSIDDILDYVISQSVRRKVYYLWRPFLRDPKDDMVLELAIAASCKYIVTYNKQDFAGIEQFGLKIMTPKELLKEMGEIK